MISTKSYQWVLPHVFPRNKCDVIRKFQTISQILRKFDTIPHRIEYFSAHTPQT